MFYVTGDPHDAFRTIRRFARERNLNGDDVIVVLGYAGINYYLNERDLQTRKLGRLKS